jgi:hypothetical protein
MLVASAALEKSTIRVRDPARIDRILDLLGAVWRAHPDQRLGQLLLNFGYPWLDRPNDATRPEDDQLEDALLAHLRLLEEMDVQG